MIAKEERLLVPSVKEGVEWLQANGFKPVQGFIGYNPKLRILAKFRKHSSVIRFHKETDCDN